MCPKCETLQLGAPTNYSEASQLGLDYHSLVLLSLSIISLTVVIIPDSRNILVFILFQRPSLATIKNSQDTVGCSCRPAWWRRRGSAGKARSRHCESLANCGFRVWGFGFFGPLTLTKAWRPQGNPKPKTPNPKPYTQNPKP